MSPFFQNVLRYFQRRLVPTIGSLLIILFAIAYFYIFTNSNTSFKTSYKSIYIADTTKQELDSLIDHGEVFKRSWTLKTALLFKEVKIRKGLYEIPQFSSNQMVIDILNTKPAKSVRVPIGKYRFRYNLTVDICRPLDIKSKALRRYLSDSTFCKSLDSNFTTENIYTLFINDTIWAYRNTTGKALATSLYHNWLEFWTPERLRKSSKIGLTPQEVVIVASITDAETAHNSELRRVAGLYLNRLRDSVRLQSDPTIVYANGQHSLKRIRKKHLRAQNPYNTYRYEGLPPGPVYVPTTEAVDAVLNHEKHDFYFFVASTEKVGYHDFSRTFDEHKEKASRYRKWLNSKHIY